MATVNARAITQDEFEATLQHTRKVFCELRGPLSKQQQRELAARVLDKMIDTELLVQHARTSGVRVSGEQVEEHLERVLQEGGGEAAFVRFLRQTGHDPAAVRHVLERTLVIRALRQRIRTGIEVTEDDIAAYQRAHPEVIADGGSVEFAHILFKDDQGGHALERARAVRRRILDGLAFDQAARQYSGDEATRQQGGHLGILARGTMIPAIEDAAFSIGIGKVSTPVESPLGVHLLKVIRRVPGTPGNPATALAQVIDAVRDQRLEREMEELVCALRGAARIEKKAP